MLRFTFHSNVQLIFHLSFFVESENRLPRLTLVHSKWLRIALINSLVIKFSLTGRPWLIW
jgi:hypothetical protein